MVDDEKDFADLVVRVATQLGYTAAATSTAEEFMASYLADPPDVIVLDIVMPDQDGIELMRWLVDRDCRARVILASGYSPVFAGAAKVIAEIGGRISITYLRKPAKLADLRAALAPRG